LGNKNGKEIAMNLFAIDPGNELSAYVILSDSKIASFGKVTNEEMMAKLFETYCDRLVIEQIRGFGITAGNTIFDTCVWTGRFAQAFGWELTDWIPRKTIVTHLCGTSKAGDSAIREALAYRYGCADLKAAKGTRKAPGPLYGFADDMYSALAVGLTWLDRRS
jgi:hypothetical protein